MFPWSVKAVIQRNTHTLILEYCLVHFMLELWYFLFISKAQSVIKDLLDGRVLLLTKVNEALLGSNTQPCSLATLWDQNRNSARRVLTLLWKFTFSVLPGRATRVALNATNFPNSLLPVSKSPEEYTEHKLYWTWSLQWPSKDTGPDSVLPQSQLHPLGSQLQLAW